MLIFLFHVARIGFILSLFTYAAAFQDLNLQQEFPVVWVLHFAIFAVWIPTVMFTIYSVKSVGWKGLWNRIPGWMKIVWVVLLANSIWNIPGVATGELLAIRRFSAHWMTFYFLSMAILASRNGARLSRLH